MYAVAHIRYRRPLEEFLEVTDRHRAYLKQLKEEGILIASGRARPIRGGSVGRRTWEGRSRQDRDMTVHVAAPRL
jgi:uncharacterized protein YciI